MKCASVSFGKDSLAMLLRMLDENWELDNVEPRMPVQKSRKSKCRNRKTSTDSVKRRLSDG